MGSGLRKFQDRLDKKDEGNGLIQVSGNNTELSSGPSLST